MYGDRSKLLNIISDQQGRPRFVLGIDGLSRSGKTTFADDLRELLIQNQKHVCLFHIDDYIVQRRKRYNTGYAEWHEQYHLQWDVKYLRENLFSKVRESHEITLQSYNLELDEQFQKTVCIPPACIIIIEGVFLQRPEWRGFFDYLVYFDCPRELRFSREDKSVQDNIEKFRNRYWKAEDYYLNSTHPVERSDMIITT